MSILKTITNYKQQEVAARKRIFPENLLKRTSLFERKVKSMSLAVVNSKNGIIAEHKRRSPSKSNINTAIELPKVIQGYEMAGVAAVSVLTDTKFFGGSLEDLALASSLLSVPILRKEFIVDPYQIIESKAYGADAILLIAACLSDEELIQFSQLANDLGLEVLLEVHNHEELQRSLLPSVQLLGVNNRNLKSFEVSLDTSRDLLDFIPEKYVKVSESGLSEPDSVKELRTLGYQGFLMGEHFMRSTDPGKEASKFIQKLL
ncbi:MAG: indole-3-glycerol phosphate synthase TrpC [Flavobacteriaceae bacterium]|nr:indole-3-glycerol phosphate synthase TrpC [Flavobacteriaceae bacterium]